MPSDKVELGLNVDMLDVDRLRDWARLISEHGSDISRWGSVPFVAGKLTEIANRLDQEIRDVGKLRRQVDGLQGQLDRCAEQHHSWSVRAEAAEAELAREKAESAPFDQQEIKHRRACECSEPDPVQQADDKFYCHQCSFETGARPNFLEPERSARQLKDPAAEAELATLRSPVDQELYRKAKKLACDCADNEYHQTGNKACVIAQLLATLRAPLEQKNEKNEMHDGAALLPGEPPASPTTTETLPNSEVMCRACGVPLQLICPEGHVAFCQEPTDRRLSGMEGTEPRPICAACKGTGWCEGSPAFACSECGGLGQ